MRAPNRILMSLRGSGQLTPKGLSICQWKQSTDILLTFILNELNQDALLGKGQAREVPKTLGVCEGDTYNRTGEDKVEGDWLLVSRLKEPSPPKEAVPV